MKKTEEAPLISRKDFLRLRFGSAENSSKACPSQELHRQHELLDMNISTMQHMDLPPEFRSLYTFQSKILGFSDTKKSTQEVEEKMLQALWETR